jgi:hypothetical protein
VFAYKEGKSNVTKNNTNMKRNAAKRSSKIVKELSIENAENRFGATLHCTYKAAV